MLRPLLVVFMSFILFPATCAWAGESDCPETAVSRPAMQTTSHVGFTRARASIDLMAEASQKCLEVTADIGETIGTDGIFARLDTTFIDLGIKANEAEQKILQNRIDHAQAEWERYRILLEKEQTSQSAFDTRQHELDQTRLALATARIEHKRLQEERARHTITAPAGWVVMERNLEPGQWVGAGTVVGRVGDFQTLLVPYALAPEEIGILEKTRIVELLLPDYEGVRIPARILRVSPAFDPISRKTGVDLVIADPLPDRREGVRAVLELATTDPAGAVLIPACMLEERYEELYLRTPAGNPIRVMVLSIADGTAKVTSPDIRPGQTFISPASDQIQ